MTDQHSDQQPDRPAADRDGLALLPRPPTPIDDEDALDPREAFAQRLLE